MAVIGPQRYLGNTGARLTPRPFRPARRPSVCRAQNRAPPPLPANSAKTCFSSAFMCFPAEGCCAKIRLPGALPAGDLGLLRVLELRGTRELEARSQAWRPWRAYAAMYLWNEGVGSHGRRNAVCGKKRTSGRKNDSRVASRRKVLPLVHCAAGWGRLAGRASSAPTMKEREIRSGRGRIPVGRS
jgi:hypothetical protein